MSSNNPQLPEILAAVLRLYQEGKTRPQIAEALGVPRPTVDGRITALRNRGEIAGTRFSERADANAQADARIQVLYKQGESMEFIAQDVGLPVANVAGRIKRLKDKKQLKRRKVDLQKQGELASNAKLTAQQAKKVIALRIRGMSAKEIIDEMQLPVDASTITAICTGRSWPRLFDKHKDKLTKEVIRLARRQNGLPNQRRNSSQALRADVPELLTDLTQLQSSERKFPRPHQQEAVELAQAHFATQDRGQLIMACGTGKTLTALWIAEALGMQNVIVALPSLQLQAQSVGAWLAEASAFPRELLVVGSDRSIWKQFRVRTTTDPGVITKFLRQEGPKLLFTTYQSGVPLIEACRATGASFDLGIVDEAHRTAGRQAKLFAKILDDANGIVIRRRLFMTATPRFFEGDGLTSMDNEAVYGSAFYRIATEQAIAHGILSDYKVLVLWVSSRELGMRLARSNKSRFHKVEAPKKYLAMAVALEKAAAQYGLRRLVTFHKSVAMAALFGELVQEIRPDYDVFHVNHRHNVAERQAIMRQVQAADVALLTNAKVLLEGFDLPEIDAVGFADTKKSHTEVIQAIGRCLRRYETKQMGYVLLPIFIDDEGIINQQDFQNASMALAAMGAQDSRILSHFRAESTRPAGEPAPESAIVTHLNTTPHTIRPEALGQLRQTIGVRVWNRLRVLAYRPYAEAKAYAQQLAAEHGIDGKLKWDEVAFGRVPGLRLPPDIPNRPDGSYPEEFEGWREFLGTASLSYEQHQQLAREHGVTSLTGWFQFYEANKEIFGGQLRRAVATIPGWTGAHAFFGKEKRPDAVMPYQDAKTFAQDHLVPAGISSKEKWFSWVQGKLADSPAKPVGLPNTPSYTYGQEWEGWTVFFGTKKDNPNYRDFDQARTFAAALAQQHGITTSTQWRAWAAGELPGTPERPADIPEQPREAYLNRWRSWGFFFRLASRAGKGAGRH